MKHAQQIAAATLAAQATRSETVGNVEGAAGDAGSATPQLHLFPTPMQAKRPINTRIPGDCGYAAFYMQATPVLLWAPSRYAALSAAIRHFKPRNSARHMVHVHLVQRADGSAVVHTAD